MIRYRLSETSGRPSNNSGASLFFHAIKDDSFPEMVDDIFSSESYLHKFTSKAEIRMKQRRQAHLWCIE